MKKQIEININNKDRDDILKYESSIEKDLKKYDNVGRLFDDRSDKHGLAILRKKIREAKQGQMRIASKYNKEMKDKLIQAVLTK